MQAFFTDLCLPLIGLFKVFTHLWTSAIFGQWTLSLRIEPLSLSFWVRLRVQAENEKNSPTTFLKRFDPRIDLSPFFDCPILFSLTTRAFYVAPLAAPS